MNGGPESGGAGEREPEGQAAPVTEPSAREPEVSDADYAAAAGPPPDGPAAVGHVASLGLYLAIWAGLMVLTALTVFVAFFHLGPLNDVVAVAIALTKGTLVALYFMHVRWSSRLVALCLLTGMFFVVHLMGGTLQDYFTRGLIEVPGK